MIESKESTNDRIKRQTLELYEQLPQDYDERIKRTDIRDKVVELNYTFFGYVASRTFINNSMATYEDKLQSCICGFLQIWWKFKYAAKYRTDLSFSVFFKPRLSEMIERELNEVKYSVRRTLCMEVGDQVGKHWAQVKYDDLSDPRVNLPPDKMSSLKAIFGTLYMADLETVELFTSSENESTFRPIGENYDSIHDLLIHEMVYDECKLTDKKLLEMADMYGLNFWDLKRELPNAERDLYAQLRDSIDISEAQIS